MASTILLLFVLMLSCVHVSQSADSMFTLRCKPAVGEITQTVHISCSTETEYDIVINTIIITRIGEEDYSVAFLPLTNEIEGDKRFKIVNRSSLELNNAVISDEGEYRYYIRTNLGQQATTFTIKVTAKYHNPIITTVPVEIVNDSPADLSCTTSGGYPPGHIHWFDGSNTNWTKNAVLITTQRRDGLFTLSSTLSFKTIDSAWGDFTCLILNNTYGEVGGIKTALQIKDGPLGGNAKGLSSATTTNSIAAVVVIGSLIVGLLTALLVRRKMRNRHATEVFYGNVADVDV